jgi:signal transduction histidine kinase
MTELAISLGHRCGVRLVTVKTGRDIGVFVSMAEVAGNCRVFAGAGGQLLAGFGMAGETDLLLLAGECHQQGLVRIVAAKAVFDVIMVFARMTVTALWDVLGRLWLVPLVTGQTVDLCLVLGTVGFDLRRLLIMALDTVGDPEGGLLGQGAASCTEQQRYSGLLEEVQRLKAIVQKLLILARADAGRLDLRLETIDLSAMIESAAEDAAAMAPHLQVEKQILPGVTVKADRDLMGQVVRNLTSNAVKYNYEKGLIRFQLSVRDNEAHVTISNTGVPIPTKDRERIFNRFYRVDQSRSRTVPGTGLGLSLAREIARAHKGDLRLDRAMTNLITFSLSLPCQH